LKFQCSFSGVSVPKTGISAVSAAAEEMERPRFSVVSVAAEEMERPRFSMVSVVKLGVSATETPLKLDESAFSANSN